MVLKGGYTMGIGERTKGGEARWIIRLGVLIFVVSVCLSVGEGWSEKVLPGRVIGCVEYVPGVPVKGAIVVLAGLNRGDTTDEDGRFWINDVRAGVHEHFIQYPRIKGAGEMVQHWKPIQFPVISLMTTYAGTSSFLCMAR